MQVEKGSSHCLFRSQEEVFDVPRSLLPSLQREGPMGVNVYFVSSRVETLLDTANGCQRRLDVYVAYRC